MNNRFKIVETDDYILAISDEEIKEGEELLPNKWYINSYRGYDRPFKNHNLDNNGYLKQVIAYIPKGNNSGILPFVKYGNMTFKELNGDGSYYECIDCEVQTTRSGEFLKSQGVELYKNKYELDLPLLPKITVEDDVEKLAPDYAPHFKDVWIEGYKAATKIYNEEGLVDAICMAQECTMGHGHDCRINEVIQAIKKLKKPKEFIAEKELLIVNHISWDNILKSDYDVEKGYHVTSQQFKTTINFEGKEVLVGHYL